MHPSAKENFKKFVEKYINTSNRKNFTFVEVGSLNINGSLRDELKDYCTKKITYIGLDIEEGKDVDKVMKPYNIPYKDYADVVISCNQLEHDPQFWRTIEQMKKCAKPKGLIYLSAPSQGGVHRYPVDVYRFYPDAFSEIAKSFGLTCVETYIDKTPPWLDNIGILRKN